ncbi:MAG: hypothetical protein ABIJ21_03875 [Nanoarchaeota archaeon]
MVGNRLELDIVGLFNDDVGASYSINEIARRLNKKYPYIHKKVTSFLKDGILQETIIGRSHLCSINLENDEAILLLSLNAAKRKSESLKKDARVRQILAHLIDVGEEKGAVAIIQRGENILFIADGKAPFLDLKHVQVLSKDAYQKEVLANPGLQQTTVILYSFERYYSLMKEIQGKLRMAYLFKKK